MGFNNDLYDFKTTMLIALLKFYFCIGIGLVGDGYRQGVSGCIAFRSVHSVACPSLFHAI